MKGEPGYGVPSGRSSVTLPLFRSAFLLGHDLRQVVHGGHDTPEFARTSMSTRWAMPSSPLPNRLVIQTLPWLSMARPLLLIPV